LLFCGLLSISVNIMNFVYNIVVLRSPIFPNDDIYWLKMYIFRVVQNTSVVLQIVKKIDTVLNRKCQYVCILFVESSPRYTTRRHFEQWLYNEHFKYRTLLVVKIASDVLKDVHYLEVFVRGCLVYSGQWCCTRAGNGNRFYEEPLKIIVHIL